MTLKMMFLLHKLAKMIEILIYLKNLQNPFKLAHVKLTGTNGIYFVAGQHKTLFSFYRYLWPLSNLKAPFFKLEEIKKYFGSRWKKTEIIHYQISPALWAVLRFLHSSVRNKKRLPRREIQGQYYTLLFCRLLEELVEQKGFLPFRVYFSRLRLNNAFKDCMTDFPEFKDYVRWCTFHGNIVLVTNRDIRIYPHNPFRQLLSYPKFMTIDRRFVH